MSEYLSFAEGLAHQAGEIMQSERNRRLQIDQKPDKTFATNVDYSINDLSIDEIINAFPGHRIIGEERSYGPEDAEHVWHVDPLDGTGEYIEGDDPTKLTYGFGIAKRYRDQLEMGLFYNPSKDELFTAVRGLGTHLNGARIHVNQQTFEPGMSYDYSYWDGAPTDARFLDEKLGPPLDHYSAIYQGCMVANGTSAFSVFPGNTAHDIAPASILVHEAGGRVTDIHGNSHNWGGVLEGAIFSNAIVHDQVVNVLRG